MRGRTIWLIVGLCVLVVAVGAWVLRGDGDVQYRTAPAERGDIAYTISATGTPNAVVTVQVGSQVSGNIKALYADFNTKVQKGQVVAQIEPATFQARVDQEHAELWHAAQAGGAQCTGTDPEERGRCGERQGDAGGCEIQRGESSIGGRRREEQTGQAAGAGEGRRARQGGRRDGADDLRPGAGDAGIGAVAGDFGANEYHGAAGAGGGGEFAARHRAGASEASRGVAGAAQIDLDHTFIRAPVDGVVVSRRWTSGRRWRPAWRRRRCS